MCTSPLSGVYSVMGIANRGSVEIGTIGNEGLVGISGFLDDGVGVSEISVLVPGEALRIPVDVFQTLAEKHPELRRRLVRYTQAFLGLTVQSGACNALHSMEQRCARWLLMTHDRMSESSFRLTQEMLAHMLGVRRPTVTLATARLKTDGSVRFNRGRVDVLDRSALLERSCECYGIVVSEFDRLLGTGSDDSSPRRQKVFTAA
jgi:CRP-like cAMP-binding protein